MSKYTVKEVGKPDNTSGDKTIYKIYQGSKIIGFARYSPRIYKSKYNIYYYPKRMPKEIVKYIMERDSFLLRPNYKGEEATFSAGTSAKNPTAVLKQFKKRYDNSINLYKDRIKARKKYLKTLSRTGLTDAELQKIKQSKIFIKDYQNKIKRLQAEIKSAKSRIESFKSGIKLNKKTEVELLKKGKERLKKAK